MFSLSLCLSLWKERVEEILLSPFAYSFASNGDFQPVPLRTPPCFHPKVFIYGKSARVIISRIPGFEALLTLAHALSLCLPRYFPLVAPRSISLSSYIRMYEVKSKLALFAHYINALISLSVWRYANFMQYHFLSTILTPMTPIHALRFFFFFLSLSLTVLLARKSSLERYRLPFENFSICRNLLIVSSVFNFSFKFENKRRRHRKM